MVRLLTCQQWGIMVVKLSDRLIKLLPYVAWARGVSMEGARAADWVVGNSMVPVTVSRG